MRNDTNHVEGEDEEMRILMRHRLIVTEDCWYIACPTGTCGLTECPVLHAHEDDESEGWDEWTFHGEVHHYSPPGEWLLPYDGCAVEDNDGVRERADELAAEMGPGDYVLHCDWGDMLCYIEVVDMPHQPR